MTMPALFVSHGAPNLILRNSAAKDFLAGYGAELGRPRAIVVASAHFATGRPTVVVDEKPGMIYDFGGFERELYSMVYPAPGDPLMAVKVAGLIDAAGKAPALARNRGYDHGTWVPLMLLYPDADVPVVQLSIQPNQSPRWHYEVGEALKSLGEEDVLVVGSGSFSHNLHEVFTERGMRPETAETPDWVVAFGDWMSARLRDGDVEALLDYRAQAPFAVENHPTDEHLLPLFLALGAGGAKAAERVHHSHQYGVLAMDAFKF
jgi:4,5-DOPA dioxygenase extradiol